MTTKAKPQFVINVSEEQKAALNELKQEFNLSDKGVMTLLLEVALNNRNSVGPDSEGEAIEIDTFEVTVRNLDLGKKRKAKKVEITPEEKERIKAEKRLAKLEKQLAEALKAKNKISAEVETEEEVETLVVSGV
jgi:hypothetical protein